MKFDIKKKLCSRSERVKCVDIHPELPWVLSSLYSGNLTIYDYSNQSTVKTFEVSNCPVRNARFISRKQWIVAGSDDLQIRIFNYNTMEKIKQIDAHSDYIRCIIVHPTQPYIISSSDDGTIKVWDFNANFSLFKTYDDHTHYVMQVTINPRDTNVIASASLDKTIKIWNLTSGGKNAHYTLTGHLSGINCLDYYKGDKPYIISGGDDRLIKIWDYQTKQCVHTLDQHTNNVSAVLFHPEIPIILSTSEDGTFKIWHSNTYKLEYNIQYNMDRAWALDIAKENNIIAIGYDEGTVVIKIGSDEPIVSMNNGKVVYAKNMEISTINLKAINTADESVKDGEALSVQVKELGSSDLYPVALRHSPNGHVFAIFNDSEYSIYRSQTFKNQGFGTGTDLIWSTSGDYAVKDSYIIKMFKGQNNQQYNQIKTDYVVEELFGGPLIGVKSPEFVVFYDWETGKLVRRIDISPKKVYWNDNNTKIVIATNEDFYVLQHNAQVTKESLQMEDLSNEGGIEEAFELEYEIHDSITSGIWINELFMYTNQSGKLSYSIQGKTFQYNHTDKKKYILGYIQQQNRLYLIDKQFEITSYEVPYAVAEYQSAIVGGQYEKAAQLLPQIPEKYLDKIAKFLDSLDQKELAYQIVRDPDFKFELAIQLKKLEDAFELAQNDNNQNKFKQIGDLALLCGKMDIAIISYKQSDDLNSQLLVFTSLGLRNQLDELARKAEEQTKFNIAFTAYFQLANLDKCIDILIKSNRISEAALFTKTYCPSRLSEITKLWKKSLQKEHPITSQKIADPQDYQEHFSDLLLAEKIEAHIKEQRANQIIPSHLYMDYNQLLSKDFFKALKQDPVFKFEVDSLDIEQENECIQQVHLGDVEQLEEEEGQEEEDEQNENFVDALE